MYNRYIPQPDGSYRRNRMPDNIRHAPQRYNSPPRREHPPQQKPDQDCPPPKEEACKKEKHHCNQGKQPIGGGVGDFLRQLLPKDFDIGDLMIVLLLLLMAGDCAEDQNTAMLTLALYLFM